VNEAKNQLIRKMISTTEGLEEVNLEFQLVRGQDNSASLGQGKAIRQGAGEKILLGSEILDVSGQLNFAETR
jgi:hypothetical protein